MTIGTIVRVLFILIKFKMLDQLFGICTAENRTPVHFEMRSFDLKQLLQPCTNIIALHMHLILKCIFIHEPFSFHKQKILTQITCSIFTFVQYLAILNKMI